MDGNEFTQDTLPDNQGQSSGEVESPSTPPEEEKIPKSEVDKMMRERHATLDKRIVSLEATAKQHQTRAEQYETQLKAQKEAADRAEYEAIKENPEALAIYRKNKDIERKSNEVSTREQQLAQSKQEHEAELKEIAEYKTKRKADEIAKGYADADPKLLVELTDGSTEKMASLAKVLWKPVGATPKKTLVSGADKGSGGGLPGKLTNEQIEQMSVEEYANHPSVKERFK